MCFVRLDFVFVFIHSEPMRFLLFFFLLTSGISSFGATIVTATVGQVSENVVTSREVQISMVIEHILFPGKEGNKGLYEVRYGQDSFRNAVTTILLESVVALEAENFNVASVTSEEVSLALAKIDRATQGRSYWAELDPSAAEIKRFTIRKLTAKSFLKFKTNSMASIITDQEAQIYYDKNRVKFGSLPFESFKENIKAYLAQQQLEERLRSWFEVIKRKYKVRNYI